LLPPQKTTFDLKLPTPVATADPMKQLLKGSLKRKAEFV